MRSAILVSSLLILLLKTLLGVVHTVDFFRLHISVQIESILFKVDWNKITPSIPVQHFPKMNSHSLTKCTVNKTQKTTIVSHIEFLLFCVRDLGSFWCWCWCICWRIATQHSMCNCESSIQGSGQTIFIVWLKLPSFAIWDQVIETSISYSFWIKIHKWMGWLQLMCPGSHSLFLSFQVNMTSQWCCTTVHSLHAIQHNSCHCSLHPNSSNRSFQHLKHPTRETDDPFPSTDERERESWPLQSTQNRVTRLGITNF